MRRRTFIAGLGSAAAWPLSRTYAGCCGLFVRARADGLCIFPRMLEARTIMSP